MSLAAVPRRGKPPQTRSVDVSIASLILFSSGMNLSVRQILPIANVVMATDVTASPAIREVSGDETEPTTTALTSLPSSPYHRDGNEKTSTARITSARRSGVQAPRKDGQLRPDLGVYPCMSAAWAVSQASRHLNGGDGDDHAQMASRITWRGCTWVGPGHRGAGRGSSGAINSHSVSARSAGFSGV